MRIALTGDLHYGITRSNELKKFATNVKMAEADAFVIAGDVAEVLNGPNSFSSCLQIFRKAIDCPILVLAGNHDLYSRPEFVHNSADLWSNMLKSMTEDAGCHYLETSNFVVGNVAIVGSYLHYDYSARDKVGPCGVLPEEWYITNKRDIIVDGTYHIGLPPDKQFSEEIGQAFRHRLSAAQDDPQIETIVVVTHVPCMECLVTRRPYDFQWSSGTPFFGNLSSESFIRSCSKVRYVFSAHSHVEQSGEIQTENGTIFCHTASSDYHIPRIFSIDLEAK